MPKDYQEVEMIVEEFDAFLDKYTGKHDKDSWIKQTLYEDTVQVRKDLIVKEFRTTLTTYGNARELQGVEKVEKKIQEVLKGRYTREDDIILEHIAAVKSELK
jgi:hypothetical protein